jgi:D-cysteine desulfhydrase
LGDALAGGSDAIITAGGLQSNLCMLTAAACARLGLDCVLVHNDSAPDALRGNMLLNSLFGARARFLGRVSEEERAREMELLADELRSAGKRPYVIHNGASTPIGALGYVSAAAELLQQSEGMGAGILHVGMVGAMGGTASGFVYGTALLGHPFHVHVISVEYSKPELLRRIHELVDGLIEITGCVPGIPVDEVMTVYDGYLGDGYAVPTKQSRAMLAGLPRMEGILLEDVYTSKTLGGFVDLIAQGVIHAAEPACYLHTGGLGSLFAQSVYSL